MAEAFTYKKPKDCVLSFARQRRYEIRKEIERLQAEDVMWVAVEGFIAPLVCPHCLGEGSVMKPILGAECDGPRMHRCDVCNGSGEPSPTLGKSTGPQQSA